MEQGSGTLSLACGEVHGGNEPIHRAVSLPGLEGVLYSHPCHGARGGDVHYVSVCGSGLLARICVADVVGHGELVAKISTQMHAHLRRSVDVIDERRIFRTLDRRLQELGLRAMTTAAIVTYYPPSRRLTISYAGHPPAWIRSGSDSQWRRLHVEGEDTPGIAMNMPLGTGFGSDYRRTRRRMAIGDRLLLITDGVLDAENAAGEEFGITGVERVLAATSDADAGTVVQALLDALARHSGGDRPQHDDVTIFLGEIVAGPRGPALWHVLKNRLLTRI
jgi:sigma-B regulation protein RsbU (phosphoserine phosphatase)